jgi:ubiquinone/menaquinone biosynthesis C-methylase UbiE
MIDIDRGTNGRSPRLRSLDVESRQDFIGGFRAWMATDMDKEIRVHAEDLVRRSGVNSENDLDITALRRIFDPDPLIASRFRMWITSQRRKSLVILDQFDTNPDHYLSELDKFDGLGPGSVELNPDMVIPDYCRHEIHLQPGGYVGNELAGPLCHHGTNSFYMGQNDSDQFHIALAKRAERPADGRVERVVDLGCGIGQLTIALKEEFPHAEVWGLDVAGPMIRYGHKRAVELNLDVRFAQRLAEDTKLESGSVDLVAAYILFHEVPASIARDICAEAFRILRPGGVFDATDFATGPAYKQSSPYAKYRAWADHHYNGERWAQEFIHSDFVETLRSVGFEAELKPSKLAWAMPNYVGHKPDGKQV